MATIPKVHIRQLFFFIFSLDCFCFVFCLFFFILYCVHSYSTHFSSILLSYRNQILDLHSKSICWLLNNDKIELKWIKESSGALLSTWKEKEKHQDNVPVKICYHHSFIILFFHAFTADPSTLWSACDANTTIVKWFIRTSWVLTGNHITKAIVFTKAIPFSVIVICVIQFPADYFWRRILWKYLPNLSTIFLIEVLFVETFIQFLLTICKKIMHKHLKHFMENPHPHSMRTQGVGILVLQNVVLQGMICMIRFVWLVFGFSMTWLIWMCKSQNSNDFGH